MRRRGPSSQLFAASWVRLLSRGRQQGHGSLLTASTVAEGPRPLRRILFRARGARPGPRPSRSRRRHHRWLNRSDELVQRFPALQFRQTGPVPGPEVHRQGPGHPGGGAERLGGDHSLRRAG